MNDNSLVIDTRGLTKTFKGVNALQSLDLKVPKNSIFGFLGPNGAGKTTTIKLLLGLSRPTGGSACVFGLDSVKDSTEIRRRVGYLAQDPRYYEGMTARQTLRYTARFFYTGSEAGNRGAHRQHAGTGRLVGQGGSRHQGLLRRRTPAARHRAGADQLP